MDSIRSAIRSIPDFPKPGILFRDITTLLLDRDALKQTIDALEDKYRNATVEKIVAIESRGFTFGTALADRFGCGVVLARKPGKLPCETVTQEYKLEYGTDTIEIHKDAIAPDERCLIVDDLLATGGTAEATARVIEKLGGKVIGAAFVVGLPDLNGFERLKRFDPFSLVDFDGH